RRRARDGTRAAVPRPRARPTLRGPGGVRAPEPCRPRLGGAWPAGGHAGGTGAMAAVTLPRVVGDGRRESEWRRSRWLAALPTRTAAELLLGWQRLVLLSPHPDDETLACGGLLRAAGAMGLDVQLVSVTDGEACYPGDPAWPPARLRQARRREGAHAPAALGARCCAAATWCWRPGSTMAIPTTTPSAAPRSPPPRRFRAYGCCATRSGPGTGCPPTPRRRRSRRSACRCRRPRSRASGAPS